MSRRRNRRRDNERTQQLIAKLRVLSRLALPSFLGAVVVCGIWAGWHYVVTGPYFRVQEVNISGLDRVPRSAIFEETGLVVGLSPMFELDTGRLRHALEALPWVSEAEVRKELPATLWIEIVERKPIALFLGGGALRLTDPFGHRFAVPQRPEDLDHPVITGVYGWPAGMPLALATIRAWERGPLSVDQPISEVHVDPVMGVTVYTREARTAIRLGRTDANDAIERIQAVYADLERRGSRARYMLLDDEDDPDRVVVRAHTRGAGAQGKSEAVSEKRRNGGSKG